MATTATNKQPLFVDRVFHYVADTNSASLQLLKQVDHEHRNPSGNAITTDGAIVEDICRHLTWWWC